jgi:uncharacterized protein involved in tolerance to divalent cations|tara:strand:+ start:978 stop:1256 length:279 start_codon:yes stop_codon:yes gene_type:complete
MRVMIEFELSVLTEKSYAKLEVMEQSLTATVNVMNELKESFRVSGKIQMAAQVEARIIRMKENIDKIKIAMTSKESDSLESFALGIEPTSLN